RRPARVASGRCRRDPTWSSPALVRPCRPSPAPAATASNIERGSPPKKHQRGSGPARTRLVSGVSSWDDLVPLPRANVTADSLLQGKWEETDMTAANLA